MEQVLCRSCAGFSYYTPATAQSHLVVDVQLASQVTKLLHDAPAQGRNGSPKRLGRPAA